ncbi:MAG: hypothetical protein J6Y26_05150 [Lachnospiraceae bacterium]|nr:hypothetical protein [Lachnospiraceae bacterium]
MAQDTGRGKELRMKAEDLYESIGTVDEDLLERSEKRGAENTQEARVRRITPRMKVLIAVASVLIVGCVIGLVTGIFLKKGDPRDSKNDPVLRKYVLAGASLPDMKMPDDDDYEDSVAGRRKYHEDCDAWWAECEKRLRLLEDYGADKAYAAVDQFTVRSLKTFLSGRSGQNKVYSPINIYLMLGMLAESTAGNSRDQILSLAGADSVEDMRALSKALWNRLYRDADNESCLLGASVWLDEGLDDVYNKETLQRLASEYYASSFSGEMGSKSYSEAFRKWLDNMTGGMLKDSVEELELHRDTLIALATTIYLNEQWSKPFSEENTKDGVFHAVDGDKNVPFMYKAYVGYCYRGEKFTAVSKDLESSTMWMILPNDGVSVDEILDDPDIADLLSKKASDLKRATIYLSVPKFDVSDSPELIDMLKELGVTDIFDTRADFSPLFTDGGGAYVGEAKHSVRVQMSEDGVKAAAYVEVQITKSGDYPEEDEITITLDRPFLFLIDGDYDELPLFAGVVENP